MFPNLISGWWEGFVSFWERRIDRGGRKRLCYHAFCPSHRGGPFNRAPNSRQLSSHCRCNSRHPLTLSSNSPPVNMEFLFSNFTLLEDASRLMEQRRTQTADGTRRGGASTPNLPPLCYRPPCTAAALPPNYAALPLIEADASLKPRASSPLSLQGRLFHESS